MQLVLCVMHKGSLFRFPTAALKINTDLQEALLECPTSFV